MNAISPRPRRTISGAAYHDATYADRSPTSSTSASSSGFSQNGFGLTSSSWMAAALLTSRSSVPHSSRTRSNSAATCSVVAVVDPNGDAPVADVGHRPAREVDPPTRARAAQPRCRGQRLDSPR